MPRHRTAARGRAALAPAETVPPSSGVRLREEGLWQLLSAGLAIFSEHSLDGVLQRVVDAAREVVGARYAALGVLAPDGASLANFVSSGLDAETVARIGEPPRGRGLLGLVIRERRPIRTADIARHPEHFGFPPHHPVMTSFLGVPITTGQTVFGNLYLTEKIGAEEFSDADEAVAVLLAAQAAVAVANARLHERGEQLLEQLQATQRQRDLSYAMMNHELRNALTGVYGWAERVAHPKTPEAGAQAAHELLEGTERTIALLNNFLDLTRLDLGKVMPVWREVSPAEAVRRALKEVEPAAEARKVPLAAHTAAAPASFETDPARLHQILVNLLSNAVRLGPPGRPVTVTVQHGAESIAVAVADEGPGVPAELRERIFEPFERLDPHSGHGTGLGLPVSRRLAELLGGSISVGDRPGGGAVFTLSLPLARRT